MENKLLLEDGYLKSLGLWLDARPLYSWQFEKIRPENAAILVVDMTNGFCCEGALASPRVKRLIPPIVEFLQSAWGAGVRHIFLLNDEHDENAVEFGAFPAHCVAGTPEAEPVAEIKTLPFFEKLKTIPKNSLAAEINTSFLKDVSAQQEITHFFVVGNCTDLCVYQAAMFLRLSANAYQMQDRHVIVPGNCVDTYDFPVSAATQAGAIAHPGDMINAIFLQHMALNGIEVVREVKF